MNVNEKATDGRSKATKKGGSDPRRFHRYATSFKGKTSEMNGKVFQLLTEQPKKG